MEREEKLFELRKAIRRISGGTEGWQSASSYVKGFNGMSKPWTDLKGEIFEMDSVIRPRADGKRHGAHVFKFGLSSGNRAHYDVRRSSSTIILPL